MHGEIGVDTQLGRGSTFWFTVKLGKQPSGREVHSRGQLPKNMQGKRILAVDDNATNRSILGSYLNSWGCITTLAENSQEALDLLNQAVDKGTPFELAIIDFMMPGMNGEELAQAIRNNPRLAKTHLLLMTSSAQRGDASRAREAGFNAYLTKPIKQSQIFDVLLDIFGKELSCETDNRKQPRTMGVKPVKISRETARILLAEDNLTNRKVALSLLEKFGYQARAVENGKEALQLLESNSFDLILMDVQMPVMDGYEATQAIRQSSHAFSRIPIIAMTANAMSGDREKCLAAGMNDYIAKPVAAKALQEIVDRWLSMETDANNNSITKDENGETEKIVNTGNTSATPEQAPEIFVDSESPILNYQVLVDRLMGDEELATTIIKEFIQDLPTQISMLEKELIKENIEDTGKQAHKIKGAADNIGAYALKQTAFSMEKAAKAGRKEELDVLMLQLTEEHTRLHQVISRKFPEKP